MIPIQCYADQKNIKIEDVQSIVLFKFYNQNKMYNVLYI